MIVMPALHAASKVGWNGANWVAVPMPPRLMLITLAPWVRAQSTPSRMSAQLPDPVSPRTLTGMSCTLGAMPAMPTPLFAWATMVPAVCEPCPWTSVTSVVLRISLRGQTIEAPARSG